MIRKRAAAAAVTLMFCACIDWSSARSGYNARHDAGSDVGADGGADAGPGFFCTSDSQCPSSDLKCGADGGCVPVCDLDCGGVLVCGFKGSDAGACQCPAVADGGFFFDAYEGGVEGVAPFPTGAALPHACHLPSLSAAIREASAWAAAHPGFRAQAISDHDAGEDTLYADGGLTLPNRVGLTSTSHDRLYAYGFTNAAVTLGAGSALSNVTLEADEDAGGDRLGVYGICDVPGELPIEVSDVLVDAGNAGQFLFSSGFRVAADDCDVRLTRVEASFAHHGVHAAARDAGVVLIAPRTWQCETGIEATGGHIYVDQPLSFANGIGMIAYPTAGAVELHVDGGVIRNNGSAGAIAGFTAGGPALLELRGTTFFSNVYGVGANVDGRLSARNCRFDSNAPGAAVLNASKGLVEVFDSQVLNANTAISAAGPVALSGLTIDSADVGIDAIDGGTVTDVGSTISGGTGTYGVWVRGGEVTLNGTVIHHGGAGIRVQDGLLRATDIDVRTRALGLWIQQISDAPGVGARAEISDSGFACDPTVICAQVSNVAPLPDGGYAVVIAHSSFDAGWDLLQLGSGIAPISASIDDCVFEHAVDMGVYFSGWQGGAVSFTRNHVRHNRSNSGGVVVDGVNGGESLTFQANCLWDNSPSQIKEIQAPGNLNLSGSCTGAHNILHDYNGAQGILVGNGFVDATHVSFSTNPAVGGFDYAITGVGSIDAGEACQPDNTCQ